MTSKDHSRSAIFLLQSLSGTGGVLLVALILELLASTAKKVIFGSGELNLENIESFSALILIGCVMGYLINRRLESRLTKWVWILPLIWLLILMSDFRHAGRNIGQEIWMNFFSNQCDSSECLYELAGTLPLVGSIGYSVGAWLALRRRPVSDD